MACYSGPEIVNDGLVLHLDAANLRSYPGSGTVWKDLSNSHKNDYLSNGPVYSPDAGGCLTFDGVDDYSYVNFAGMPNFSAITINVWYYSNVNSSTCLVKSMPFILHFKGAGFYLRSSDNVSVSGYLGWQVSPSYNKWNMLTGTWDGSVMKLYINSNKQSNELSFTGGSTGLLLNNENISFGGYFNASQPYTNGKISSAQLYNRALTAQEIQQNFNATRSRYGI